MSVPLSTLLGGLPRFELRGAKDISISGLCYDSRKVQPGELYFAFPGLHTDGHEYIDSALARGASAVVLERFPQTLAQGIAYVAVPDARLAMSPVADAFHGNPSSALRVIGVTGTEGKSTTVYLIHQLLKWAGARSGYFSTVTSDTGSGDKPNPEHQTTPEATAVHSMLASMRDAGLEYAVVESSSHGLSPRTGRLADLRFDVGVMTNVTHEHLEFHGTWERYRDDKANLFRALDAASHIKSIGGKPTEVPAFGLVNADDPSAEHFRAATSRPVYSFSASGGAADFSAREVVVDAGGASFSIRGPGAERRARINLPGAFNVGNALAALAAVSGASGIPWEELLQGLPSLKPVRGRMTSIDQGQSFEVIIDYAHTPSSFQAILPSLRQRVGGRLICLFGSGGERDRAKRPLQGKIASAYCDIVVLADEDPRGENPMELLEEIAVGCEGKTRGKDLFLIPDRPEAIRAAFNLAAPGDAVVLLGKGHENSIIYAAGTRAYDEEAEARSALAEAGFHSQQPENRKETL